MPNHDSPTTPADTTWLVCGSCYADYRFVDSPSIEYCAQCEDWHNYLAGVTAR